MMLLIVTYGGIMTADEFPPINVNDEMQKTPSNDFAQSTFPGNTSRVFHAYCSGCRGFRTKVASIAGMESATVKNMKPLFDVTQNGVKLMIKERVLRAQQMRVCLLCKKRRKTLLPCIGCNTGLYCDKCDIAQCTSCQTWNPGNHECDSCGKSLRIAAFFTCESCSNLEDCMRYCDNCMITCDCVDGPYTCRKHPHLCKE